ncbi:replicative DNA helicase [Bacillus zhangzhouensis]|uniref:Replicative DNA helicase n=1 Tax=Bacillus zhangzhouensis TaxID=1178540 RepID=A0A081LES3_9BACI|nr:replicative DNA helicase [Bacillus zhangzhouensis]KEP27749.1 DNA helicase [Bacillus zhangzhouensis]
MTGNIFYYNDEAEQQYLGAILQDPDLIKYTQLKPQHFYRQQNQSIFKTLQELDKNGEPIDLVAIIEHVGRENIKSIGGREYLSGLMNTAATTSRQSFFENVIIEYWQKREIAKIAADLKESSKSEDTSQVIQEGISSLMSLEDATGTDDDGSINNDLVEIYQELETPKGDITGMPSGFTELDRMTSGFQRQELIIIAARPSVGKTAFCLNVAKNFMESPINLNKSGAVGIFSLEMGRKSLLKRMQSSIGNINAQSIRASNLNVDEWGSLSKVNGVLDSAALRIFDQPGMTVNDIWAKARKMKREFEGKDMMIIIDYLQLIVGNPVHRGNRTAEIGEISRMLKQMARELDIAVIALSQLSRGVEQRQEKRPMMSDIRESGQIEQDADVIGFLYRDDYYDKESENKNIIEVIIAKQRNGPVGTVSLAFIKEFGKFVNLDHGPS